MLDRESLSGPEDICIIGNEAEIRDQLQATFDSGADDVIAVEFGSNREDETRTREALASLL